jgi:hypothetical protein
MTGLTVGLIPIGLIVGLTRMGLIDGLTRTNPIVGWMSTVPTGYLTPTDPIAGSSRRILLRALWLAG